MFWINKIRRVLAHILWVDPPEPQLWIKLIAYTLDQPQGQTILSMPTEMLRYTWEINPNVPLMSFSVAPTQEIVFQAWLHE